MGSRYRALLMSEAAARTIIFCPLLVALLSIGLLAGCSSTVKPEITVLNQTTRLEVNGKHFSHTTPSCATLSIIGMPSGPPAVHMGNPTCVSGTFEKFYWNLKYIAGCTTDTTQAVTVLAIDDATFDGATAHATIPWGRNCAFVGTCGDIGQRPCPTGCVEGSVSTTSDLCSCGADGQLACTTGKKCLADLNPTQKGSKSICTPCGQQGQPACDAGNKCQLGLHLQLDGAGNLVCEAGCGYPGGYYCTPAMVAAGDNICSGHPPQTLPQLACVTEKNGHSVYTCYAHSTVSGGPHCGSVMCQGGNSCEETMTTGPKCSSVVAEKCD
jgi:hypothetical protein